MGINPCCPAHPSLSPRTPPCPLRGFQPAQTPQDKAPKRSHTLQALPKPLQPPLHEKWFLLFGRPNFRDQGKQSLELHPSPLPPIYTQLCYQKSQHSSPTRKKNHFLYSNSEIQISQGSRLPSRARGAGGDFVLSLKNLYFFSTTPLFISHQHTNLRTGRG